LIKGRLLNPQGQAILDTVYRAESSIERMRGLLGRAELGSEEGFWIEPCNAVHTLFMTYPLDVLFLDGNGVVLKAVSHLKPWRFAGTMKARATLELAAGRSAGFGRIVGKQITWQASQ